MNQTSKPEAARWLRAVSKPHEELTAFFAETENKLLLVEAEVDTLDSCLELERILRESLVRIEARKSALVIQGTLQRHREDSVCVVCQESQKTVVLVPCGHLCLCEDCSEIEQLVSCPLCRKEIIQRIKTFV